MATEGLRAFKNKIILGYELIWKNLTFDTRCFVKLEQWHVQRKAEALKAYASQSHRHMLEDFIFSLGKQEASRLEHLTLRRLRYPVYYLVKFNVELSPSFLTPSFYSNPKFQMQKVSYILFIFLLLSLHAAADNYYGQTIYAQNLDNKDYRESLTDLSAYLAKITGKTFSVKNGNNVSSTGIVILINQKGLLDDALSKKLENGSGESFVLSGNNDRLLIVANHFSGLVKGIYSYLDWLGVKWYFPGEKWEKLVSKTFIIYSNTNYISPSFLYRNFFGTGGIRPMTNFDPNEKVKKEWEDWKRRNRMGSEFDVAGHYGEVFNANNRQVLQQHPEFLALVKGKREWNGSAKWCISNAGFRKLFIEDRVNELKADLVSKTYQYKQVVLSVDPSDGGGDCECDNCKKIGTASERYYFLANEVAKAFAPISPRASVSLLAYNTHATPPSFALESNVVVMIVPYAFQNFGTPEQMIDAWSKRHKNLLIYDYYSIPDWQFEVPYPRKTSADTLSNRIISWKKKGIKGFNLESVYGTGLAGLGLYFAARIGWDDKEQPGTIKKNFLNDMFGAAAPEVGQYYDFLNTDYTDGSGLPFLRNLLTNAVKRSGGDVTPRIIELEAYVHYLNLFSQWQISNDQNGKSWEELIQYVWAIYPLKVIHSTRIADLFWYRLDESSPLYKDWNIAGPYGPKLRNVRFINEADISKLTEKDSKQNPALEGFTYKKVKAKSYSLKAGKPAAKFEERWILGINWPKTFVRTSSTGIINFSLKQNESEGGKKFPLTIKCIDTTTGSIVYSKRDSAEIDWKEVSIKLVPNKTYKLEIGYRPWLKIGVPENQWMAFGEIPTYSTMATLWFFVPENTKYIYFSNTIDGLPVFKNACGKIVQAEKADQQTMFRLPAQSTKGEWWNITSSQLKGLTFYGIPDLFFTHPGYVVTNP